jgi:hypothetical protein
MKRYFLLWPFILICIACLASCNKQGSSGEMNNNSTNVTLRQTRPEQFKSRPGENKVAKNLYNAIWSLRVEKVNEALLEGGNPNYCLGEAGWIDSNPLNVISWYPTYPHFGVQKEIPDPTPDVAILQLLINNGADINKRPYIWSIVYQSGNNYFEQIRRRRKINNESLNIDDIDKEEQQFVTDVNRLIKAFLTNGTNPDKLGHSYPYSQDAQKMNITDEQAEDYFSYGTRAINVAIEKGIKWESQVDLLLQYTKLDEESLKAAERSHDSSMVEKITKLWEEQIKQ